MLTTTRKKFDRVQAAMKEGMSASEACKKFKMPVSYFYKLRSKEGEAPVKKPKVSKVPKIEQLLPVHLSSSGKTILVMTEDPELAKSLIKDFMTKG